MNRCKFSLGLPLFGPFWAPLATIGDTSRKDTPPIVSKPQPGCPVTRSMPFQPFGTTRVLKVIFWSFLAIFVQCWPFLGAPGPKFGTSPAKTHSQLCQNLRQCTNWAKTSETIAICQEYSPAAFFSQWPPQAQKAPNSQN